MNFRLLFLSVLFLPGMAMAENILSVAPEKANVRSGPGAQYDIVWEAAREEGAFAKAPAARTGA